MALSPNLAEILAKINDGICVLDKDRQVSFVNDKASQILNALDDDFLTKVIEAAKDQSALRFEYFHQSMQRWFEHQVYANADGSLTLISRDITSRHRLEEALRASEERFRRLIESNIIGVIVVKDGIIIEANDVFLKMVDRTREDLVTRQLRWRELTPVQCDAADAKARVELESTGAFSPYEKEFFRQGGGTVPVLIGGVSTDSRSDIRETLCLIVDLTERRRADDRMRSIVECGKILASSLQSEDSFPKLAEYIASRHAESCAIFVTEEQGLIRIASAHPVSWAGEAELESDVEWVRKTGEHRMVLAPQSRIVVPIVAAATVGGVLAVSSAKPRAFDSEDLDRFDHIAQRAGLALENARLYGETQRASRLKDEFVAMISHELRTPLTPILGGVYMIRSDPHDEAVSRRALELIERSAKAQVKIIDDLLDVSRALSGKLRINLDDVDLSQVIQEAVDTVRPASEAKGIQIEMRLEAITGAIAGDADRLQQVVWNLLANSVKFTQKSGRILVELAEVSGYAEIRVTDTGIGIEPDFLPHVFEKFRQADASRTRSHGGLGLGLAIVRHLVESHGGTVHAISSGQEKGATFVVRLPLRRGTASPHVAGP